MKSFNESTGSVEYKSNLELQSFKYCDFNKHVKYWSAEPFYIPYVKPTTQKIHRYFPDLFIEFQTGAKFLVEVKHSKETKIPKKPKKLTTKSERNYNKAMQTFLINTAKWESAKEYCAKNGLNFIILTENELT